VEIVLGHTYTALYSFPQILWSQPITGLLDVVEVNIEVEFRYELAAAITSERSGLISSQVLAASKKTAFDGTFRHIGRNNNFASIPGSRAILNEMLEQDCFHHCKLLGVLVINGSLGFVFIFLGSVLLWRGDIRRDGLCGLGTFQWIGLGDLIALAFARTGC